MVPGITAGRWETGDARIWIGDLNVDRRICVACYVPLDNPPQAGIPVVEPPFVRLPAMDHSVHEDRFSEHLRVERVFMLKLDGLILV
jgi:hypothetical protein